MKYSIHALPSAREEFSTFLADYGEPFRTQAPLWLKKLATAASKGRNLPTADVFDVLEKMLDPKNAPQRLKKDWKYAYQKFQEAGSIDRIRAIFATIRSMQPPWESHFTSHAFSGHDGSVNLELEVYFRVDRVAGLVIFDKFEACTPGSSGTFIL